MQCLILSAEQKEFCGYVNWFKSYGILKFWGRRPYGVTGEMSRFQLTAKNKQTDGRQQQLLTQQSCMQKRKISKHNAYHRLVSGITMVKNGLAYHFSTNKAILSQFGCSCLSSFGLQVHEKNLGLISMYITTEVCIRKPYVFQIFVLWRPKHSRLWNFSFAHIQTSYTTIFKSCYS